MIDRFENQADSKHSPLTTLFPIVPDDVAELPAVTRGLYVATTATLVVDTAAGDVAVTIPNLAPGVWHPLRITRVHATGTTPGVAILGGH